MEQELINISVSLAKENFVYCKQTMELKQKIEGSFILLGKRLMEIRDKKKFLPNYENFNDFVVDIKLDPGTASKLIKIYQHFIIDLKIHPKAVSSVGSWTNVYEIVKVVKTKKDAREWLDKAKHLTKTDLQKEIMEVTKGVVEKDCPHDDTYKLELQVCRKCGAKYKVHETGKQKK